jgi:peptidyl-tRNA hydrolase, PTH1 family
MRAIVGLGNPGSSYQHTRHNVGFDVLDELARRWDVRFKTWKSLADVAVARAEDALLAKPQTFMNASGEAVQRIVAFHKLVPSDVLVVVDEVQLPLGRIRLRSSGSDGGHNGLKSVIQHVGREFPRLRVGVGRGDPLWNLADHVLSRFDADERPVVGRSIARAADAIEVFLTGGIGEAMNRYNAVERTADDEERAPLE